MRSRAMICMLGVVLTAIALLPSNARAGTILVFGETSTSPASFTATRSGSSTTLSASDVQVSITNLNGVGTSLSAFFSLSATSDSAAATDAGGHITQNFDGSFHIYSGAGMTGTNYLSGAFDDTVFGAGTGAAASASTAGGSTSLSFTSDVIPTLALPRAMSLSFTDVSPALAVVNNSIDRFSSNVAGTFSAAVPEPASVVMLGFGVGVVGILVRRRKHMG